MLTLTALAASLPLLAYSASLPPRAGGLSFPIEHTHHSKRVGEDGTIVEWLMRERAKTEAKYGAVSKRSKRSATTVTLQDTNLDASYSATVEVGTPATSFKVILDTGSADFWLAGSDCTSGCTGVTTWDPSTSSTFDNLTTAFEIEYGSGDAEGYAVTDTVTLGGLTQTAQKMAVVTSTVSGLITSPLSGLMGMGFEALSNLDVAPWWQAQSSSWSQKLFAFKLARYRDVNSATSYEAQGGYFDVGGLNSSHYTGDINYITTTAQTYWQIPVNGLSVQGKSIDINITSSSSGSSSSSYPQVAVDTGTTLISVPTATAEAVWAEVDGASALNDADYKGYYEYPCDTTVNVTLTFGSVTYTINSADMNVGVISSGSSMCLGGLYGTDLGDSSTVQWIVGDTFLKNVYSVYVYSGTTSQVGFASLAGGGTVATGSASNSTTSTGSSTPNPAASSTTSSSGSNAAITRSSLPWVAGVIAASIGLAALV